MDLDPYQPNFEEYQRRIKKSYEDFLRWTKEFKHYHPAGEGFVWEFDDEKMCMRKLKTETQEWEPYGEF